MQPDPEDGHADRRRARRLPVDREDRAFVHIDLFGRSHWKLNLVEISSMGVGFLLDDGRPSFAVGTQLDHVKLDIVGLQIAGSIRVAHITRKPGAYTVCGAEFHPSTESDQRTMALLLGDLERRSAGAN